jgi:hypothetical protein
VKGKEIGAKGKGKSKGKAKGRRFSSSVKRCTQGKKWQISEEM